MASDSSPNPPPQGRGGLSLYANLLDPNAASSGATISRAPVSFSQSQQSEDYQDDSAMTAAKKQQLNAAALRFQPTKRPQLSAQKSHKPKSTIVKPPVVAASASINASTGDNSQLPTVAASSSTATATPAFKTTLADWAANEDEDDYYAGAEKRQRGGRKKRKKNKEREEAAKIQNWDDIYDPSRPNIYEDYKHSEEKYREIREWKDRLYAHRMRDSSRRRQGYSSEEYESDQMSEDARPNRQFAPPGSYSFAPPPPSAFDQDRNPEDAPPPPPPPPPPAGPELDVPDDVTGEDAYARRMRMSQGAGNHAGAAPPPPPPPPPQPAHPEQPDAGPGSSTISRAPVRYSLPSAPADIPATEAELEAAFEAETAHGDEEDAQNTSTGPDSEEARSLRPGQKGFAARLMSKYGWTKGSGLGASGSGIVNPLRVQVEKRKKKSDAEGGGFVGGPAAKGKIIGSKTGQNGNSSSAAGGPIEEAKNDFSSLSNVVILKGMLNNIDIDDELQSGGGDGGIMQEIGDECAEKYGRVERVFIYRGDHAAATVFVKFTSQLSALRAVQALQGRIFNGNTISAGYWDTEKFEDGIYS